jgi:hypothetical protein
MSVVISSYQTKRPGESTMVFVALGAQKNPLRRE